METAGQRQASKVHGPTAWEGHASDDPLIGTVRSIDVETTLTNGSDIVITGRFNTAGSFDGTDRAEVPNPANSSGAASLAGGGGNSSLQGDHRKRPIPCKSRQRPPCT